MNKQLKLFGTDWCLKSSNIRNYLQSKWIDFDDHNVEKDPEAEKVVRALYNGELKFPTVLFENDHIKNPSISELDVFLQAHGIE